LSKVKIEDLTKNYVLSTNFIKEITGRRNFVNAVSEVSLNIAQGEILGVVGESGCGKTTLGKMLINLEKPTNGQILIDGNDISKIKRKERLKFHKDVQMIFQDPFDSLNPKMTVFDIISEPIHSLKLIKGRSNIKSKVIEVLEQVDLSPAEYFLNKFPNKLSGGQRQRIAIARAIVVNPNFIIADEPVSMLDVSIRAGILNLLKKLNYEKGVGILFITHDLATARFLCNRIAVMYLGRVVELIKSKRIMKHSLHPYTNLLLESAPDLFSNETEKIIVKGEAANATMPPQGCRFAPRCPFAESKCIEEDQHLTFVDKGKRNHEVACWKTLEENLF